MKKIILSVIVFAAISFSAYAQSPEAFKYQSVIRDASQNVIPDQVVGIQLTILQGSISGTTVYQETFAPTTNTYGLVNLEIGTGTVVNGTFATIDWSNGPYFIETAMDASGGTSYVVMGTSQLLSVPYALHAKTADNIAGGINELDPVFDAAVASGITAADTTNWNNHTVDTDTHIDSLGISNLGFIAGGITVETDPVFGAAIASGITATDTTNWNNHTVDTDTHIDSLGISNLGFVAGGITVEIDGDTTNEIQDLSIANDTLSISGSATTIDLTGYANAVSGTTDYMAKFTSNSTIGDSQLRDNGIGLAVGTTPNSDYMLYLYETQLTADGDGQASLMARRTRDSQNDGTGYGYSVTNTAVKGYNYWGDVYSFGVGGFSYNDYTRTGGVIGAYQGGTYWGALGYKNSASATYGVYATSALTVGTGILPTTEAIGIGGGFFGDLVGSTSHGAVIGQLNSGELFAQYNKGNVYTFGKNIELVQVNEKVTPVYNVSSTEAIVYAKGTTQLTNGSAYITFTEEYKMLLGENPVITATPNGECNGVYVSNIDKNGFTITELMNGTSNATISWISVGNRVDNDKMELATQIVSDPNFERNLQQVLFSDGNIEGSASGIWWDGSTIQFGKIPANLTKVKRKSEEK